MMTGEFEAAGDALTGGIAARAVEREIHAGGADVDDGRTHETACLNCGAALAGPYCNQCGQHVHVHRTLGSLGHDILHGVFHFEGKIWRTIPELVLRPGKLTRRYIDGERAKFVSPMALFLFCVFLMFAVFPLTGGIGGDAGELAPGDPVRIVQKINADIAGARAELAKTDLTQPRREALKDKVDTLIGRRDDLEVQTYNWKSAVGLEVAKTEGKIADTRAALAEPGVTPERKAKLEKELASLNSDRMGTAALRDNDWATLNRMGQGNGSGNFKVNLGWGAFDGWLNKKLEKANANTELLLYKLKTESYKFAWALIPISIPFVWLLFFWRREFPVYDHAVFTTYSLCFMMLLVVTLSLATTAGLWTGAIVMTAMIAPPVHMYKQLKGTYGLGRASALVRLFVLLLFSLFAFLIFALLLLTMGLAG